MRRATVSAPQTAMNFIKRGGRSDCQIILTLATIMTAARTDFMGIYGLLVSNFGNAFTVSYLAVGG
jgi:hypothetical protein